MPSVTRRSLVAILATYPVIVGTLSAINVVAPQRNGPLAISQVFAPHLLVGVILLLPLIHLTRSRMLRAGLAAALVLGALRFGSGLVSLNLGDQTGSDPPLILVSWNLEAGDGSPDVLLELLRTTDADVVALQELTPEDAAAIRAAVDVANRFPHLALEPQPGVAGLGLLSRMPIIDTRARLSPAAQVVRLEVAGGKLTVINAHPFPPRYQLGNAVPIPLGYDASTRDADLSTISGLVPWESGYARALLVGDFNVTDREPGYDDLAAGLWDAHREVGFGPGSTWRPSRLEFLSFGILRIDYLFGSPGTRPLTIGVDCAPRVSDHCVLRGVVALD